MTTYELLKAMGNAMITLSLFWFAVELLLAGIGKWENLDDNR